MKMVKGSVIMRKEKMLNLAGVLLFYLIIILGVIALNEGIFKSELQSNFSSKIKLLIFLFVSNYYMLYNLK